MRKSSQIVLYSILIVLMTRCEIEKTEFARIVDDQYFQGFSNGYFITHQSSISFYSPEKNKVFDNLYFYQNGKEIGDGLHSFVYNLISYEDDNVVEWIDPINFISDGFLNIEQPRNIQFFDSPYFLISYGKRFEGGVAIVDNENRSIVKNIPTDIKAGKIINSFNYLYVLCEGKENDSLIYRLYGRSDLHKVDSFYIGLRPVDAVNSAIEYPEFYHPGLAILCKGNATIPASIVLFDHITGKVNATYSFGTTAIKPENLFWLENYPGNDQILVSYINNKLYKIKLGNPIELSVLIDKNISQLLPYGDYFLAVSRDTTQPYSALYRFNRHTLSLIDSLKIAPNAIEIVH